MTGPGPDRLTRLPIQVAPHPEETTGSYIRRLARANHLKPSYLRMFLNDNPFKSTKPELERLAALSGRSPQALQRTLTDAGPCHRPRPTPHRTFKRTWTNKAELYERIRHDAATEGLSMRALERRHQVAWRTVRSALAPPKPDRPRRQGRRPSSTKPIRHLLDTMIANGLGASAIWAALIDEHDIAIPYARIRNYVFAASKRDAVSPKTVRAGQSPPDD